jgi:hypothetical protein
LTRAAGAENSAEPADGTNQLPHQRRQLLGEAQTDQVSQTAQYHGAQQQRQHGGQRSGQAALQQLRHRSQHAASSNAATSGITTSDSSTSTRTAA